MKNVIAGCNSMCRMQNNRDIVCCELNNNIIAQYLLTKPAEIRNEYTYPEQQRKPVATALQTDQNVGIKWAN